ncbi:MAG: hypothetical protein H7Z41_09230 [Cytophagales bacterium]|nr:hypothetical protein [Armatimonadota bacterium]
MKPIKKEELPKLIVLIVLAVGVLGFALVQFLAAPGGTPTAAATTGTPDTPGAVSASGSPVASATDKVPGAPGSLDALGALATDPELDFLRIGPPLGGKDPFTPNGRAAPVAPQSAAPARPAPVAPLPSVVSNENKRSNLQKLLGLTGSAQGAPGLQSLGGDVKPLIPAAVELPAPDWAVSGIVLAERDSDGIKRGQDVAILHDSTGSRRFVTVGDPVDNGYHVSAVRSSGVEIRNKRNIKIITLSSSSSSNSSARAGGATVGGSGLNGVPSRAN